MSEHEQLMTALNRIAFALEHQAGLVNVDADNSQPRSTISMQFLQELMDKEMPEGMPNTSQIQEWIRDKGYKVNLNTLRTVLNNSESWCYSDNGWVKSKGVM